MSTNENSDPTGTRVTRSLRKRLTSVDSDVSMRASTPTLTNLQSIQETTTPSKRTTRRTSLSTPVATPSKAKGRTENIDSPARRTTRRRSVSIIEHVEHLAPIKSIQPTIAVVTEEDTVDKSAQENRRVTRSSSKSPQEIKSKMSAAKKKSPPEKQEVIISLDDFVGSVSPNKKQTKILIKKEKNIDEMLKQATPSPKKKRENQNESTPKRAAATQIEDLQSDSSKKIQAVTEFISSPAKIQSQQGSSKKSEKKEEQILTSTKLDISQKGEKKNCLSTKLFSPSKKDASLTNAKLEDSTSKKATKKKNRVSIELFSPSKKNASLTNAMQDDSPQKKKTRPEKLKNVAFNETAEEETMKNVFPKTPGLTKSKSYILDSSKDVEKELSTTKFSDNHNEPIAEGEKKTEELEYTDMEEDHEEVPTTKTPYKWKLKVVESSTPVQIASPKKNKDIEVDEDRKEKSLKEKNQSDTVVAIASPKKNKAIEVEEDRKEKSLKEKKQSDTEAVVAFPKSWSHSVSGKVSEKAKLDSIESEDTLQKKLEEEEARKKADAAVLNKSNENSSRQALGDTEDEDDLLEQDDDEDDDLDDGEENREITIFIDDEAMEVPEGEESMDSEERQYLEENEVPAYGESIGSEDSEDAEFEEEADEEDDAFIVSDSEDINCPIESDSEDEIENKPKGKKYKRIIRRSESSLDEEYISSKLKDKNVVIEEDDKLRDNIDEVASKDAKLKVAVEPEEQVVNKSQRKSTSSAEKSEKTTEKERKSLNSSRRDVISLEEVSDVEMEDLEQVLQSTQVLNKSKLNESVKVDASDLKSENNTVNVQETMSKEEVPNERKSLKKTVEADNEDLETKAKSQSIVERKSLTSNIKLRKSSGGDISEQVNWGTQEVTTKSLNKSKHEVSEGGNELEIDNSAAVSSENKSRKSLNKSKLEAQLSEEDSEKNHSATTKPVKVSRKSLNKSKLEASQMADVLEENVQQSEDGSDTNILVTTKPTKASRKSLNKSKLEASQMADVFEENVQQSEDGSDTNIPVTNKPTNASRKSLNKSKLEASQMADVLEENPQQTEDDSETNFPATTKPTKDSRNSLNKSKLEASQISDDFVANPQLIEDESEKNNQVTTKTMRASRKSLNKSKQEASQMADDFEEIPQETSKLSKRASLSKEQTVCEIPAKGLRRKSMNPVSELQNEEHTEIEDGKSKKWHDSDLDHEEDNIELPKEEQNKSMQKSRKSTDMDDEKAPKQNLNTSRKSMARSSIEGANDEEEQHSLQSRSMNKSKLEKTVLSFEDNSEPEETLSSSEVPSRTSGSLNSSRRKSLSLNQSKLSESDNESDTQPESSGIKKALRKTSIDQNLVLRVDTDEEEVSNNDKPDQEEEHEDHFSNRSPAEKSTIMEFLGEEDDDEAGDRPVDLNASRRRSSANKSKLDETFELDIAHSVSRHENLHRSIMRKSLNHSAALKGEMEQEHSESEKNSDSDDSSAEGAGDVHKKNKPGLSVSLSNIEIKKKKLKGDGKLIHNSFTIGVSVKTSSKSPSPSLSCPDSESECEQILSEQEDLEKIKNIHRVDPFKSSNSLSTSLREAPANLDESKKQKRIKRTSLYLQENAASQSFVENITEEKKKVSSKRKRLSNSFCGVIAPSMEEEVPTPQEEKKNKKSLALSDDKPLESGDKTNLQRILSRCDEILEAANMAKREAKLSSKKTKVKKPKWMDNVEKKESQEENDVKIPLVSRKELKRKEKIKKELAKAIKHSTAMLETIDPKLAKALKTAREAEPEQETNKSSKRLPIDFLNTLVDSSSSSKKKNKLKEIESTPPSDKENSKKSSNKDTQSSSTNGSQARKKNKSAASSSTSDTQIEKKKKKHQREVLETATGTVIVEPSTPVKQRVQNGFRESPKTPAGFKVQDIYSAGQNERDKSQRKGKKLFTASGEFIEEDLSLSTSKANPKKEKTHKRKRHIEEPIYSLPKTQWTPSGVFVEEDLYSSRPLANSTATQFTVTSLNGSKKIKNATKAVSSTSLNSALSFKQNAVSNANIRRETGRQLIHRKQRQVINKQF